MADELFIETGLPEWLCPPKKHVGPPYADHQIVKVLDHLSNGRSYASLVREDPTLPTYRELFKYLRQNPKLLDEYYEAQTVGTEALVDLGLDLMRGIAEDGTPSMDDVSRVREQLSYIKWVAGARNSKRYGEKRQVSIETKIDLSDAMKDAEKRVLSRRVIEGEFVVDGEN